MIGLDWIGSKFSILTLNLVTSHHASNENFHSGVYQMLN